MGPYGWGKNHSVIEWLFAEGYRFDFFQAVRLLEILNAPEKSARDDGGALDDRAMVLSPARGKTAAAAPHVPAAGNGEQPKDFVRFKSAVRLNFPTSDIDEVRLQDYSRPPRAVEPHDGVTTGEILERAWEAHLPEGHRPLAEMTVNLMGLAGALGPLDTPTTELIIERMSKKDTALKDFLDIFNHRLISLLYRIRKMHSIALEDEPPGQDKISQYLFSIIGLNTGGLRGRMQVRDRSLLYYAGLLGQQPRSLVGLERILSDYFKIKVKGHQFVGQWYELEQEQWTRIGETGQNQVLGRDAVVLGTRVWDQQAKIEIQLGPLTLHQFLNFIPTGWGFRSLCDLTRFYLGDALEVSFRLVLKGAEVPPPVLGMVDEPRLGWTSWLTIPESRSVPKADDSQVEISLSTPRSEFISERLPLFFNLPPVQLAKLIRRMKVRSYRKFSPVMRQGERGDSMFAIRSGRVSMTRREEDGKVTTLGILGPGECFGEMTLLIGKHRETTVTALENCVILELHKKEFEEFAAQNSRWRQTLKAYRYGQFVKHQESSTEFFV
jgi:type VI secretion system protein ImpH